MPFAVMEKRRIRTTTSTCISNVKNARRRPASKPFPYLQFPCQRVLRKKKLTYSFRVSAKNVINTGGSPLILIPQVLFLAKIPLEVNLAQVA